MGRLLLEELFFTALFLGLIGLLVYLLLNNSPKTSKALKKLRPKQEEVPKNMDEESPANAKE